MKSFWVAVASVAIGVALLGAAGCSKPHRSIDTAKNDGKVTGSPSDPPVVFQAQWGPSNRYVFHSEITTSTEMPRQGQARLAAQDSTLGLDYVVTVSNPRPNGSRNLELEINSVQFEATMGETPIISYDSLNKVVGTDDKVMAERLEKIVGSKISFQVSASNRVSNVRGINEITDKLYSGGSVPAQAYVRRLLNAQYLRHLVDLLALPADPVRVNATWPGQITLNAGPLSGALTADVTYSFRGWQNHNERKCALVDFSGTVKPRGPGAPSRSISSTVESGTLNGKSWFDPDLGMIIEHMTDHTATAKGSIRWRRATTNDPPQTFTSTLRQHTSVKLIDVEVAKPAT
jgi:hypothetical protein